MTKDNEKINIVAPNKKKSIGVSMARYDLQAWVYTSKIQILRIYNTKQI